MPFFRDRGTKVALGVFLATTVYALLVLRIPESPRYLVAIGEPAKAAQVLSTIYTVDVTPMVDDIEQSLQGDHKPRFSDIRGRTLGLMPIVWIGIMLSAFQQFVGINVIFYYSSILWQAVGFSEDDSLRISVISGVINIVATLIAALLVGPWLLLWVAGAFAVCWLMVLPPRTLRPRALFLRAFWIAFRSKPKCSEKFWSSAATSATGRAAAMPAASLMAARMR